MSAASHYPTQGNNEEEDEYVVENPVYSVLLSEEEYSDEAEEQHGQNNEQSMKVLPQRSAKAPHRFQDSNFETGLEDVHSKRRSWTNSCEFDGVYEGPFVDGVGIYHFKHGGQNFLKDEDNEENFCYRCDICFWSFARPHSLKRHFERKHINPTFLSHKTSKDDFYVKKTMKTLKDARPSLPSGSMQYPDGSAMLYICRICFKFFDFRDDLINHHASVHPPEKDRSKFICNRCPKSKYSSKTEFLEHMHVHFIVRKFPCNIEGCMMSFALPNDLHDHKKKAHGLILPSPRKHKKKTASDAKPVVKRAKRMKRKHLQSSFIEVKDVNHLDEAHYKNNSQSAPDKSASPTKRLSGARWEKGDAKNPEEKEWTMCKKCDKRMLHSYLKRHMSRMHGSVPSLVVSSLGTKHAIKNSGADERATATRKESDYSSFSGDTSSQAPNETIEEKTDEITDNVQPNPLKSCGTVAKKNAKNKKDLNTIVHKLSLRQKQTSENTATTSTTNEKRTEENMQQHGTLSGEVNRGHDMNVAASVVNTLHQVNEDPSVKVQNIAEAVRRFLEEGGTLNPYDLPLPSFINHTSTYPSGRSSTSSSDSRALELSNGATLRRLPRTTLQLSQASASPSSNGNNFSPGGFSPYMGAADNRIGSPASHQMLQTHRNPRKEMVYKAQNGNGPETSNGSMPRTISHDQQQRRSSFQGQQTPPARRSSIPDRNGQEAYISRMVPSMMSSHSNNQPQSSRNQVSNPPRYPTPMILQGSPDRSPSLPQRHHFQSSAVPQSSANHLQQQQQQAQSRAYYSQSLAARGGQHFVRPRRPSDDLQQRFLSQHRPAQQLVRPQGPTYHPPFMQAPRMPTSVAFQRPVVPRPQQTLSSNNPFRTQTSSSQISSSQEISLCAEFLKTLSENDKNMFFTLKPDKQALVLQKYQQTVQQKATQSQQRSSPQQQQQQQQQQQIRVQQQQQPRRLSQHSQQSMQHRHLQHQQQMLQQQLPQQQQMVQQQIVQQQQNNQQQTVLVQQPTSLHQPVQQQSQPRLQACNVQQNKSHPQQLTLQRPAEQLKQHLQRGKSSTSNEQPVNRQERKSVFFHQQSGPIQHRPTQPVKPIIAETSSSSQNDDPLDLSVNVFVDPSLPLDLSKKPSKTKVSSSSSEANVVQSSPSSTTSTNNTTTSTLASHGNNGGSDQRRRSMGEPSSTGVRFVQPATTQPSGPNSTTISRYPHNGAPSLTSLNHRPNPTMQIQQHGRSSMLRPPSLQHAPLQSGNGHSHIDQPSNHNRVKFAVDANPPKTPNRKGKVTSARRTTPGKLNRPVVTSRIPVQMTSSEAARYQYELQAKQQQIHMAVQNYPFNVTSNMSQLNQGSHSIDHILQGMVAQRPGVSSAQLRDGSGNLQTRNDSPMSRAIPSTNRPTPTELFNSLTYQPPATQRTSFVSHPESTAPQRVTHQTPTSNRTVEVNVIENRRGAAMAGSSSTSTTIPTNFTYESSSTPVAQTYPYQPADSTTTRVVARKPTSKKGKPAVPRKTLPARRSNYNNGSHDWISAMVQNQNTNNDSNSIPGQNMSSVNVNRNQALQYPHLYTSSNANNPTDTTLPSTNQRRNLGSPPPYSHAVETFSHTNPFVQDIVRGRGRGGRGKRGRKRGSQNISNGRESGVKRKRGSNNPRGRPKSRRGRGRARALSIEPPAEILSPGNLIIDESTSPLRIALTSEDETDFSKNNHVAMDQQHNDAEDVPSTSSFNNTISGNVELSEMEPHPDPSIFESVQVSVDDSESGRLFDFKILSPAKTKTDWLTVDQVAQECTAGYRSRSISHEDYDEISNSTSVTTPPFDIGDLPNPCTGTDSLDPNIDDDCLIILDEDLDENEADKPPNTEEEDVKQSVPDFLLGRVRRILEQSKEKSRESDDNSVGGSWDSSRKEGAVSEDESSHRLNHAEATMTSGTFTPLEQCSEPETPENGTHMETCKGEPIQDDMAWNELDANRETISNASSRAKKRSSSKREEKRSSRDKRFSLSSGTPDVKLRKRSSASSDSRKFTTKLRLRAVATSEETPVEWKLIDHPSDISDDDDVDGDDVSDDLAEPSSSATDELPHETTGEQNGGPVNQVGSPKEDGEDSLNVVKSFTRVRRPRSARNSRDTGSAEECGSASGRKMRARRTKHNVMKEQEECRKLLKAIPRVAERYNGEHRAIHEVDISSFTGSYSPQNSCLAIKSIYQALSQVKTLNENKKSRPDSVTQLPPAPECIPEEAKEDLPKPKRKRGRPRKRISLDEDFCKNETDNIDVNMSLGNSGSATNQLSGVAQWTAKPNPNSKPKRSRKTVSARLAPESTTSHLTDGEDAQWTPTPSKHSKPKKSRKTLSARTARKSVAIHLTDGDDAQWTPTPSKNSKPKRSRKTIGARAARDSDQRAAKPNPNSKPKNPRKTVSSREVLSNRNKSIHNKNNPSLYLCNPEVSRHSSTENYPVFSDKEQTAGAVSKTNEGNPKPASLKRFAATTSHHEVT